MTIAPFSLASDGAPHNTGGPPRMVEFRQLLPVLSLEEPSGRHRYGGHRRHDPCKTYQQPVAHGVYLAF